MRTLLTVSFLLSIGILGAARGVWGTTPTENESGMSRRWLDRFFVSHDQRRAQPYLEILYEDAPDLLSRGRSWRGSAFQLGDTTYSHGIAFNSVKHLLVRLGGPGDRFRSEVGLENNDDTQRGAQMGHGSVSFQVLVGGREVFSSPVMRLGDKPLPVDVPLEGASEFEIRVGDGGDGRGWDQALWAGATVRLQDGTEIRLQDFPLGDTAKGNPYGISFLYDGQPSASLLGDWKSEVVETSREDGNLARQVTYTDPRTGLSVQVEAVLFKDFPALEWVAYLENQGKEKTPILESIQAVDTSLGLRGKILHWSKGAVASFDDFAPQEARFEPGFSLRLQPGGGRSSSQVLPFFNIEGEGEGAIAAIGWTGEWATAFSSVTGSEAHLTAGMAHTHLSLEPGERIRTPRILLLGYEGDRWRGQNLLRRFILAYHRPRKDGKPLHAPITNGNWGGTAAEVHLDNVDRIIQHGLQIEYYWIDAEWFGKGPWPTNVGNWVPKADLYPQGFNPISDKLQKAGKDLLVWFEPERVYKGTTWYDEHPEWLLGHGQENALWNLGNPDARRFLTDFISAKVDEFGLGCYRQDFNIDPLSFWQNADAPDRQGMTEIRYIEGLYAFWDELLARHPHLIIDNCASGGRRIDLETVGRATPFWRTDGPRHPIAHQCHSYGLLPWVPFSATSQDDEGDVYEFRSSMCSSLCLNWWITGDKAAERIPEDFPYAWARGILEEYLSFRDLYYGDFYPLTGYSQEEDVWMAYQLDLPEEGRGMVVVLKRPAGPFLKARLPLRGLSEDAQFKITNLDTKQETVRSREQLLEDGIEVELTGKPDSVIFRYEGQ